MTETPDPTRPPSSETDLLAEVEHHKILAEEQPLAGQTVLTTVFCVTWREWIARFSEHSQIPVDALISEALARHAERLGFPEPPPEKE